MLCGARSLYTMAQWGKERHSDRPGLLLALGRSPCVATLHRVCKGLVVPAFERAVDGKTLRGIHGEQLPGVHLVAVYALELEVVLDQVMAPDKGQELAATKAALAQSPLAGGDYVLPVKENQPDLRRCSPLCAGDPAAVALRPPS